jgi:DNA-binding NarL/FixJ family response regulator
VRVVVADDSVLLREGLVRILEQAGFEVIAQAGTFEELLLRARSYKPDIVITDIRMPPTHGDEGIRAAKQIRAELPETAVLVLSQYIELGYAMDLLGDGTERTGYLLKDRVAAVADFVDAVRRVAEGGSAVDPAVVSQLVGMHRDNDPLADLTPREREVLELMAEGRSNSGIAAQLVVTDHAVEKHIRSILQKLAIDSDRDDHRRVLAVLTFLRATTATG